MVKHLFLHSCITVFFILEEGPDTDGLDTFLYSSYLENYIQIELKTIRFGLHTLTLLFIYKLIIMRWYTLIIA